MSIIEQLARYIFQGIELDLNNVNSDDKKVIYQLLYIGLTKVYGTDHFSPKDIEANFYQAENGMNTIKINILGKELYFFKYGDQIQALTPDNDVLLNIDLLPDNTYELYVKNTFNTVFRYTVEKIIGNNAGKYRYNETQGDYTIAHGDLIPLINSKTNNSFKMVVYDLNTGEVMPDDDSFFKKISDSLKKDDSTNTTVQVPLDDPSAQINNLIRIFDILKVKLGRYYNAKKNVKSRVKKLR